MSYGPGTTYIGQFTTQAPASGAQTDADSLPTAKLTRNGTDDAGVVLTVAKLATGRYKVTGTIPATYAAGDAVQISVTATVGGITGGAVIDSFTLGGGVTLGDNPVAPDGTFTMRRGQTYRHGHLPLPVWTDPGTWPDLRTATSVDFATNIGTVPAGYDHGGGVGGPQTVYVELRSTQTSSLPPQSVPYTLRAMVAGSPVTLKSGTWVLQ